MRRQLCGPVNLVDPFSTERPWQIGTRCPQPIVAPGVATLAPIGAVVGATPHVKTATAAGPNASGTSAPLTTIDRILNAGTRVIVRLAVDSVAIDGKVSTLVFGSTVNS